MFATVFKFAAHLAGKSTIKKTTVQDPLSLMEELKQAVVVKAEARDYLISRNRFDNYHERCLSLLPVEAERMKARRRERVMAECLAQIHAGYCRMQRKMRHTEIQALLAGLVFETNQKMVQKAKKQRLLVDISKIAITKSHQRHLLHLTLTHELSDAVSSLAYRKKIRNLKRVSLLQLVETVEARRIAGYRLEIANQFQEVMKEIVARPFVLRLLPVQDNTRPVYDPMAAVLYFNMFGGLFSLFHLLFFLFTATRRVSKLFNQLDSLLSSPEEKARRMKRLRSAALKKRMEMLV